VQTTIKKAYTYFLGAGFFINYLLIVVAWYPCYHGSVIKSFKDTGTEDLYNDKSTKKSRKVCPQKVWKVARRKLAQLNAATALSDLKIPPANQLEALKDDREGQHSIRINKQYRVCFEWSDSGVENVEVTDYHD